MRRKRLTKLAVERLRPKPGQRLELSDGPGGTPGLGLRVTARGIKTWSLLLRVAGKQRRITLGRYPDLTLAEARKAARQALEQADRGLPPGRPGRATVESIVESYIERHVRRNGLRSAARIEQLLRRLVLPRLGQRPIGDLRRADVLDLVDDVARTAPVMANRTLAQIKRLTAFALERGEIETNPIAGMRPPFRERSRTRVLSDSELAAIWRAAPALGWPFGPIAQLLILTAARRGELAGLAWTEVDFEPKLWVKPASRTKAGREQQLPLSEAALAILRELPRFAGSDLVFPSRGVGAVSGFSYGKRKLDQQSGVEDWCWHDLRRTAASGMAKLGVSPLVVGEILGHSRASLVGVTAIYNRHSYARESREAIEHWAAYVTALAEGRAKMIKSA
jgi:integrase